MRRVGVRKNIPSTVRDRDVDGSLGSNDHHLDAVPTSEHGSVVGSDLEELRVVKVAFKIQFG